MKKSNYHILKEKKEQLEIQFDQAKSKSKKSKIQTQLNELMPRFKQAEKDWFGVGIKSSLIVKMEGSTRFF